MYARLSPLSHESLYDAITRWMGVAPTRLLRLLLWSGSLGAIGALAIDLSHWPVALGLFSVAAAGEWGLLEHHLMERYSRPVRLAGVTAAALALSAALVTLLVGFFVFLGPAPHF